MLLLATSLSPVEISNRTWKWARKTTHTPCPQDPKQNSLRLWRRQWEEDGNCEQRKCVHYVWLRPSRQRDTWRDLGSLLGGMRVRLLSMWFHWCHLHDHSSEGKPSVPCWVCSGFPGGLFGFPNDNTDFSRSTWESTITKRRKMKDVVF